MHFASRNGHLNTVKLLIEAGADVNAVENYGFTPLHEAAENNRLTICEVLVLAGANPLAGLIKSYDEYKVGDTPANIAQKKKHTQVANFLAKVIR